MKTFLAAVGDANDPRTWSGIPYHFLLAAREAGLVDEGLPLTYEGPGWRARRLAWNALRPMTLDRPGGFQYSPTFLERLWAPARGRLEGAAVINTFQLDPPSVVADARVERWWFIDQTLTQLLRDYGDGARIGRRIQRDALRREREGYHSARGIIAHSSWAARSLLEDYDVPKERVHVVVPGANVDPGAYHAWDAAPRAPGPLRLVFVGKEWERKGLDRLLRALAEARARGASATLRVIGCPREALPPELRRVEGVEWTGFIDKRRDPARFLRLVSDSDVGCLLSRAEAGGMSLREFHALGLPTLATTAGGAPEHAIADASVPVPIDATTPEIADRIVELAESEERLDRLRARAWARRHEATWAASVDKILAFWPHAIRGNKHVE